MNISNLIRNKRFKIRSEESLILVIGVEDCEQITLSVSDCSITGLLGVLKDDVEIMDDVGKIYSSSKLLYKDLEIPLGRLVLRRIFHNKDQVTLALSTIDIRIPVGGALSKALELNFNDNTNEFESELSDEGFTLGDFLTTSYNNIDILDRCEKFEMFYKKYKDSDKYAYFFARTSQAGARVKVKKSGANKSRDELLMFGSNDYLGLSSHPEVIKAQNDATTLFGVGSTGTAPTSGTTILHQKLCEKIAEMHGNSEALVFPSGYAANIGIIAGLARGEDLIIADQLSHASIQDGMVMSGAARRFYKHNNMNHLVKVLERDREKYSGCLIITEGIFSMDGTIGSLDKIVKICDKYNARLMVDQGHCFGILGSTYIGSSEYHGVQDKVDITMGLFSKGIGTFGAYVTGSSPLMHWYKAYARSLMFATSFPPGVAAATLKSIEILSSGELQEKLFSNIERFVSGLISIGVPIDPSHRTPVVPVDIFDEKKMGEIFQELLNNGVYALPVMYPVVEKNRCRFRFSLTSKFNESDIDYTILVLKNAFEKVGHKYFNQNAEEVTV